MLKVGHRGARACEPENTLRSFRRAIEFGVDAVEFDVRRTRDDEIIVIHDATVDRTTNGKGAVNELTLKDIKQYDAGEGEKIPTLEETLDFLDKKVKMLIELKETGFEDKAVHLIRKKGLEKQVILISFIEEALKKVRELDADVQTGLLYVRHKNPVKAALELKANYLLPLYRFTHTANVQKAHENGLKVIVWNINTKEEIIEYAQKGVDGITSDKPDLLKVIK